MVRSDSNRLINVLRLYNEEAAKLFLRLDERSVREGRSAVFGPNAFCGVRIMKPCLGKQLSCRAQVVAMSGTLAHHGVFRRLRQSFEHLVIEVSKTQKFGAYIPETSNSLTDLNNRQRAERRFPSGDGVDKTLSGACQPEGTATAALRTTP